MYGTEVNLYMANIPDSKNRYNSWNFRDITIEDSDFESLDLTKLAKARGSAGELPSVNFMKLSSKGKNYAKLKTIEATLSKYTVSDDGTIKKK